jgi:FixJ family two-component response regulator
MFPLNQGIQFGGNAMRLPSQCLVWIVDDDESTLDGLQRAVERSGRAVRTFSSAHAALDQLHSEAPACLIADLVLADHDGLTLIDQIRAASWPAPAILISGQITPALTARAMRAGVFMVLEKPFAIEELLHELNAALVTSAEVVDQLCRHEQAKEALKRLSPGHLAVLDELVACRPHKQIASRLDIALRTVEKRKREIFDRLGVNTFTELLALLQTAQTGPASAGDNRPDYFISPQQTGLNHGRAGMPQVYRADPLHQRGYPLTTVCGSDVRGCSSAGCSA